MPTKSERFHFRLTPDGREVIREAAALEDIDETEFVRRSAEDRARSILGRAEHTVMPAAQFDSLLASLDTPDYAPNLARAFAHKRRFVQR
jgi:uncharacterized protein (DUF1778 family)